jgi:hypothetical protein
MKIGNVLLDVGIPCIGFRDPNVDEACLFNVSGFLVIRFSSLVCFYGLNFSSCLVKFLGQDNT